MKYVICMLLFISSVSFASSSEEIFLRAHQQYQEKNYEQAYLLYQTIDQKGSAVWYNMGNCMYHLQQYPQAIALWLRAHYDATGNEYNDCIHNIRVAEQELGKLSAPSWFDYGIDVIHHRNVPLGLLQIVWLLCWYILIVSAIITIRFFYKLLVVSSMTVGLVGIALLLMIYYKEQHTVYGIVGEKEVPIFVGPDHRFQSVCMVNSGNRVTILEQRPEWYKIQYEDTIGWIANKEIIMST